MIIVCDSIPLNDDSDLYLKVKLVIDFLSESPYFRRSYINILNPWLLGK